MTRRGRSPEEPYVLSSQNPVSPLFSFTVTSLSYNVSWSDKTTNCRESQFYNAVLFMGSVAVFSLIAQRMNAKR